MAKMLKTKDAVAQAVYKVTNVPDSVYFGSDKFLEELKGPIFLSPYAGISSLFLIRRKDIFQGRSCHCAFSYREWFNDVMELQQPLTRCLVYHNIENYTVNEGISRGYIYRIGTKNFEFWSVEKDLDVYREFIYKDSYPLDVQDVAEHEIRWSSVSCRKLINEHGVGYFKDKGGSIMGRLSILDEAVIMQLFQRTGGLLVHGYIKGFKLGYSHAMHMFDTETDHSDQLKEDFLLTESNSYRLGYERGINEFFYQAPSAQAVKGGPEDSLLLLIEEGYGSNVDDVIERILGEVSAVSF